MKNPLENFCPVPRDQRPFYQYLRHKEFFSGKSFVSEIISIKEVFKKSLTFLIISLISFIFFFLPESLTYKDILKILFLNFNLMFFYYSYLLINYNLISNQLFKSKVLYEESTWFDINTWIKPVYSIRHERLINEYQLLPVINKLKQLLLNLSLIIGLNLYCVIFF